jgi:hypothetical protein
VPRTTFPAMDHDTFWALVDEARSRAGAGADDRGADDDPLPDALTGLLVERLGADEILAFAAAADDVTDAAYGWTVWGAAYLVEGGCSDDGFMDFRDGLILAGRGTFERVVADPDSLADHPTVAAMAGGGPAWFGFESLDGLVGDAWSRASGEDDEAYYAARDASSHEGSSSEPWGESWDFDDDGENARRLPRLTALFHA